MLSFPVGTTSDEHTITGNLATTPHILVGGAAWCLRIAMAAPPA